MVPAFERSAWRECHQVAEAGGLSMFEWQDRVMEGWLGESRFGRWSAPTCGLCVPRQNGKTLGVVLPRIAYGMLVLSEQVVYTSHLQKTSTETFEAIASFFDCKALRRYLKDVKTALGREQVVLRNGARIKFLARTRNGGRGQHGDLLVFDEALELDSESQASFLPAISASANPQAVYTSTPPTYKSPGSVYRDIRSRAIGGESESTAWAEWGVDEMGDVRDRSRWYAANPSMGVLIREDTVAGECEQMPADAFAVERLGWWFPIARADAVIAEDEWDALAVDEAPREGKTAYGVKFSPDGSEVCVCAAVESDGRVHVEEVARENMARGTAWLAEWVEQRKSVGSTCVIDGKAGAQALVDRLGRMPVGYVHMAGASDVRSSVTTLADCVHEGTLSWYSGQDDLRDSAVTSTRRSIGRDGGWGFGGANPVPIEAAALAVWGVRTTKRDPRRKGMVG